MTVFPFLLSSVICVRLSEYVGSGRGVSILIGGNDDLGASLALGVKDLEQQCKLMDSGSEGGIFNYISTLVSLPLAAGSLETLVAGLLDTLAAESLETFAAKPSLF